MEYLCYVFRVEESLTKRFNLFLVADVFTFKRAGFLVPIQTEEPFQLTTHDGSGCFKWTEHIMTLQIFVLVNPANNIVFTT